MANLRRPSQNILSRDEAFDLLSKHFDDIAGAVQDGLSKYNLVPGGLRAAWRPRTRAGALNDYIIEAATERLSGVPKIKLNDDYETTVFVFDGLAAVRFKKIKAAGRPKNVLTKRQLNIIMQQEIEGIEKATFLDVQYLPNDVWNVITSVSIACYRGYRVWEFPVAGGLETYLFDAKGEPTQGPTVRSSSKKRGAGSDA